MAYVMGHHGAADLPEAHVARQAEAAHAHALERRHLQPRARRQLAHLQHTRSRRPSAPQLAAVSCSQLLPALWPSARHWGRPEAACQISAALVTTVPAHRSLKTLRKKRFKQPATYPQPWQ